MSLPICYNRTESGRCIIGCGRKCKYGYIATLIGWLRKASTTAKETR